ncbi:MAG: SGNH/GDSL hydrolase family protein, partial [Vibrio anguillarum]
MSINKIICGQSKVGEMIETINGLVDTTQSRLTSYGEKLTVFGNSISQSLNNYGTWFARKSDGSLTFYYNAGVGGNTTVQMLARLDDVPDDTTLVSIMEATNDAASAITPLQHAENIKQIAEYFIGKGIKPI